MYCDAVVTTKLRGRDDEAHLSLFVRYQQVVHSTKIAEADCAIEAVFLIQKHICVASEGERKTLCHMSLSPRFIAVIS